MIKTDKEIQEAAKLACNIKLDLVIDEEERYYKDFQKYDGFVIGAQWMQTQCAKDVEAIDTDKLKQEFRKDFNAYCFGNEDNVISEYLVVDWFVKRLTLYRESLNKTKG